jgi:hypothetical protein
MDGWIETLLLWIEKGRRDDQWGGKDFSFQQRYKLRIFRERYDEIWTIF